MKPFTIISSVALALLSACGGGGEATPDTDAPVETSAMPDDECVLGHERCGCMAGACLDGLVCLSDLCVTPAMAETTAAAESTGVDTLDDESTSDTPDDTSTTDDPTSAESTGDDASESSTDDGANESSTGTPEPVCLQGDNYCDDNMFQTCTDDGQWEVSTCQERCALVGYDSPGCASHDACTCDGFIDDFCYGAVYTLCVCNSNIYECDNEQVYEFYDLCIQEHEILVCFGGFPYVSQQTCGPANAACF